MYSKTHLTFGRPSRCLVRRLKQGGVVSMADSFVSRKIITFLELLILVLCVPVLPQPSTSRLKIGVADEGTHLVADEVLSNLGLAQQMEVIRLPTPNSNISSFDKINFYYDQLRNKNVSAAMGQCNLLMLSAANKLKIPFLVTSFCANVPIEMAGEMHRLLPSLEDIIDCFLSLIRFYKWNSMAVFHEAGLESSYVTKLFAEEPDSDQRFWQVHSVDNETEIRQHLMRMRSLRLSNSLLITSEAMAHAILQQAKLLGILAEPYSWIIMNMGGGNQTKDLLKYLYSNVTIIQFVVNATERNCAHLTHGLSCIEEMVIYDGLKALLEARKNNSDNISHAMSNVHFKGNTGIVSFDDHGYRSNFSLGIFQFNDKDFDAMGKWHSTNGSGNLVFSFNDTSEGYPPKDLMQGQSFDIVTILEKPWTMLKHNHKELQGNDRFTGFAVDLIDKIASHEQFSYNLYIVHDGKFGTRGEDGQWNGMIGEILSGNASMSIAPLSINADREEAIDFTHHFKTRSISVLIKTPKSESSFFQFMQPLSTYVWIVVLIAVIVFSVALYFLEKYNKAHQKMMPKLNRATESTWFIFGSLVQGGSESSPTTLPGRIASSAWYFFALILISTYTANLAAFLTVKKINPPISSVADLVGQSRIRYGTVSNSGVENFLQHSTIDPFKEMYEKIVLMDREGMVNSTEDGLEEVKKGDYAFLWDNTVNTYYAMNDCDYTEVGPAFDSKGFGIGVPSRSQFLSMLNSAILTLSDNGMISKIDNEYWGKGKCSKEGMKKTSDETEELALHSLAGIFIVLCGGLIIAIIAMGLEKLLIHWHRETKKKKTRGESNGKNNKGAKSAPNDAALVSDDAQTWELSQYKTDSTERPVAGRGTFSHC